MAKGPVSAHRPEPPGGSSAEPPASSHVCDDKPLDGFRRPSWPRVSFPDSGCPGRRGTHSREAVLVCE